LQVNGGWTGCGRRFETHILTNSWEKQLVPVIKSYAEGQKTEIGRIMVPGSPEKKVCKTLSQH
jgi:hypothetical protein